MSRTIEVQKRADALIGIPLIQALRPLKSGHSARGRSPLDPPRRALLVKLWGLGNLAMILPHARALRRAHPDCRIELLTLERNVEFAAACPWIDEVIAFSPRGAPVVRLLRLARELHARGYDRVLDFEQFLTTTALLTFLAHPSLAVGFATPHRHRHALYDVAVAHDPAVHMAHNFAAIARAGGVDPAGLEALYVPRCAKAAARVRRSLPRGDRPRVVLHVGSGDHFEGRRWPVDHFARLGALLVERAGAEIVFTGTAAEAGLIARARARLGAPSVDLAGRLSVLELIELLAETDLLVSNDTAPVHFAAALGTRQVAIFGPNTPRLYGPLSRRARVFHLGLACSPCITNDNAKTSLCGVPLCMRAIDPLAVADAALALLRAGPARVAARAAAAAKAPA